MHDYQKREGWREKIPRNWRQIQTAKLVRCSASGIPVRASNLDMLSLLTREPPDGKEKPEPACKAGAPKMEGGNMATLSRKSSKCDLLDQRSSATGQPSSSSEATSMSGAESSGKADGGGGSGNRDSLSGAVKDVVFQMEHSAGNAGADQQDIDGAAYPGATEW